MTERPDLVSKAARRAFRELATGTVLREIEGMWQDEGFAPGPPDPDLTGERRSLYQSYLDSVDWTDQGHVRRALRVFEQTARGYEPEYAKNAYDLLGRDGYRILDNGRIAGGPIVDLREGALAGLSDAAAIRENLGRISRAIEHDDPALAIGSAKELSESTAKVVLAELGGVVGQRDDLPKLVQDAQVALGVHPTSIDAGPDTSTAVKKILGGATSVTTGIAELRNRGFGTGHGQGQVRVGLRSRHAHLAVSGAKMWCEFMLDTSPTQTLPGARRKPASHSCPGDQTLRAGSDRAKLPPGSYNVDTWAYRWALAFGGGRRCPSSSLAGSWPSKFSATTTRRC